MIPRKETTTTNPCNQMPMYHAEPRVFMEIRNAKSLRRDSHCLPWAQHSTAQSCMEARCRVL